MPSRTAAETRRQRQREEARRTILDATEALLVEGQGEFSIRDLARRCGYTAPTVYHYFGDKDGLVDALLEERFSRLLAQLRRLRPSSDPVKNLRRTTLSFLIFGEENAAFYGLLTTHTRKGEARQLASAEAARHILEEPLAELDRAGRLRAPDRETATQTLWALIHGLLTLRIARPDYGWRPKLVDHALDAILDGLVVPAKRESPARTRA